MPDLDRSFSYAISTNGKYQDKTGSSKGFKLAVFSSCEELAQIAKKDWSPCLFTEGNRNKASFESSSFLYADVDEGCSISEFEEKFKDVTYFILTSRNHQKDKPATSSKPISPAQDRYHVLFPLERVCYDSSELDRRLGELTAEHSFLDKSVKDSARFFFGFDGVQVSFHPGDTFLTCEDTSYLDLPAEPLREAKEKQILDGLKIAASSGALKDYSDWLAVGTALKNEGYTFQNWVDVSDPGVNIREMEYKWNTFDKVGTTSGTLVHFARMGNPGLLVRGESLNQMVQASVLDRNKPKATVTEKEIPVEPRSPYQAVKPGSAKIHQQFDCDQFGNVTRVLYYYGDQFRFVADRKSWAEWTGRQWKHAPDGEGGNVKLAIKEVIAKIRDREAQFYPAGDSKGSDEEKMAAEAFKRFHAFALNAKNSHHVEGVEKLLRVEPAILAMEAEFDANPMDFNCINGTIDLKNGVIKEHDRNSLNTKMGDVTFNKDAKCPKFEKMISDVMCGRNDLVRFLQEYFGYMLTGLPPERIMVIFWGSGANGKSSVVNIIGKILGDYMVSARSETFTQSDKVDKIGQDIVNLKGSRAIIIQETTEGQRLDVQKIKSFTGKDKIRGRYNFARVDIEFVNTGKIILATNHKPTIKGDDDAAWDRVYLVPFERVFKDSERNMGLPQEIMDTELSGVLNWMLEGLKRLISNGMKFTRPTDVAKATDEYRREEDKMGQFIEEHCTYAGNSWIGGDATVEAKIIYNKYKEWTEEVGIKPVAQVRFFKELSQGRPWIQKHRSTASRMYTGIRLRNQDEEFMSREEVTKRQSDETDVPF